jgi:hypothetical protein
MSSRAPPIAFTGSTADHTDFRGKSDDFNDQRPRDNGEYGKKATESAKKTSGLVKSWFLAKEVYNRQRFIC